MVRVAAMPRIGAAGVGQARSRTLAGFENRVPAGWHWQVRVRQVWAAGRYIITGISELLALMLGSLASDDNLVNLKLELEVPSRRDCQVASKSDSNMQKICKYMHLPHASTSIAYICQNMQKICKICKHEIYMHNMHSPLC